MVSDMRQPGLLIWISAISDCPCLIDIYIS